MTSSQKQFTVDSTNIKITEEIAAPVDVINTMLVYDDVDPIKGHGMAPLVSTLFNSIKTGRLKKLLTAIVNGEPDTVKAILETYPSLLLEKLDENDYVTSLSGQRSNNRTAYRTALAVEDTEIAAMIKNKLFELTGNNNAAHTQYHDQFPDNWRALEAKRWAEIKTQFNTLKNLMSDAKRDITSSGHPEYKLTVREGSDVAMALALFRSHMMRLIGEVVTTGRHFNPQLLLKAFQIYDDRYQYDWSNPRSMLFWQQVIGTIQRILPVNYVQAFCDGLYATEQKLRNNNPQGRSLNFKSFDTGHKSSSGLYPLSVSRLGFDYAFYAAWAAPRGWGPITEDFTKLMSIKNSVHADTKTLEDSQRISNLYF